MQERLFRNEVIEAGRNRLAGTVIAAVPPGSRLYTRLVFGASLVLLLILAFGSYATTADVRGIVAYNSGVARIYPREAAEVRAIHVHTGEKVKAGQPIVTLAAAQGEGGVTPQIDQLDKQDSEVARQLAISTIQASSDLAALETQHAGIAASISSLERQQVLSREQQRLAESAARRAEKLASEGAGTQRQVEDSRSALIARKAEVEALGEQIIAQRNALRANEAQRDTARLESQRAQSVLQAQRASLSEQKAALSRSNLLVLTAPVDGVVGDISAEIGQTARPDRTVASIIPDGSALEIWLYAPSRAVGTAHAGQDVRLQFDAFPFEKYGSGQGVVTDVAQVATDPANVDPGLKITEPVFRIRTKIVSVAQRADLRETSLRPGMTLSGKLQLQRRSLWQIFLGPVFETFA